jgi:hypothetical protein
LIVLADQGSFHVGGRPGQGDYAYVQYQIPPETRALPLVMWPEDGSSQIWDTTPDGRDGFRNIFVRRGFSTYVFDEPWREPAAARTPPTAAPRAASGLADVVGESDRRVFERFRIGVWPNYYPDVQFSRNTAALEQWWRQQISLPSPPGAHEPLDAGAPTYAAAALLEKIGPAVLITHADGSRFGWFTRMRTNDVKALVSYEAASFVFPAGEVPHPTATSDESLMVTVVPSVEFAKLTTIPIQLVYGDNIPDSPSKIPGLDVFRTRFAMAQKMVDAINARGGKAELLHLPKIGVRGNTHIPMSDLNNVEIADLLSKWLSEKGLDGRGGQD